jgi:predicted dehydrogenase
MALTTTDTSAPVTLAQLGCGYWGPNLLRNFTAAPQSRVKWVAEQSEARRAFVEQNFPGTQTTPDWEAALADPEVEAVVVATPAFTHYSLAKAALNAGKHVFVEKPLAMSTSEADELAELSARREKTLMVGHTFLYNAAVRYTKKLLDNNDLGDIFYIYSQRLNLGQVRADVNAWWNLAPHDVSILLYLMNDQLPATVGAHGMDYLQPGIQDVVFATLIWPNRVAAQVQVSWLDPGKVRKLTLVGSRKMLVYDDVSDEKIAIYDKGVDRIPKIGERMDYDNVHNYQLLQRAGDVLWPHIQFQEPLKTEAAHFLDCVRTGQTPLTGPRHARDVVAVLEAVQQSLDENGRMIPVNGAASS